MFYIRRTSAGNLDTGVSGETEYGDIIKITLDKEDMKNSLSLWVVNVILHEAIHAEIYKYVNEYRKGLDPNKRKNLLGYYFQYKDINIGTAQHQHMADNFVKPIAEAIRALDNNKYPLEDYMGFGWDGLRKYGWDGYYDNGKWKDLDRGESSEYYKTQKKVLDNTNFNIDCNE